MLEGKRMKGEGITKKGLSKSEDYQCAISIFFKLKLSYMCKWIQSERGLAPIFQVIIFLMCRVIQSERGLAPIFQVIIFLMCRVIQSERGLAPIFQVIIFYVQGDSE